MAAVKKAAKKAPAKAAPKSAAKKTAAVTKPIDKGVEAKVAELLKLNARVKKANEAAAALKAQETAMREDIVALFGKGKVDGVKLKGGSVGMVRTYYAEVEDLEATIRYAKTKGNTDLIRLSLNTSAWNERRKAGVTVPGVKEAYREDLRVTLAKSKE